MFDDHDLVITPQPMAVVPRGIKDKKVELVYIICKECIDYSDNRDVIEDLITTIEYGLPDFNGLRSHPSCPQWVDAIADLKIDIHNGLFITRYYLLKYFRTSE